MPLLRHVLICGAVAIGVGALGLDLRAVSGPMFEGLLVLVPILAGVLTSGIVSKRRRVQRERANLERALEERELLFESIEVTPTPFALYDRTDRLVAWNSSYRDLHQPAFDRLTPPIHYADLMREVARQTLPAAEVESALAQRLHIQRDADGVPNDRMYPNGRWLRVTKKRTRSGGVAGFATDITELKLREAELAASEERFRALLESLPVGICCFGDGGALLYANHALKDMLAVPQGSALTAPALRRPLTELWGTVLQRQRGTPAPVRFETRIVTADGDTRDALVATTWLPDHTDERRCVATLVDVTESRAAQARIEHLASHDVLTDLGNRALFMRHLESALSGPDPRRVWLLAVDLDHFKAVNDNFGHAAGDVVLLTTARRMQETVRSSDLVCRLGGDEFAIIVEDASPAAVERIGRDLLERLGAPIDLGERQISIGASIGLACFPDDSRAVEDLLRHADIALYQVKRQGRCALARYAATGGETRPEADAAEPSPLLAQAS